MNKSKTDNKHFYEVTVCESFTRTFRVLANNEQDANQIIDEAANDDMLTCDEGDFDYNREITEIKRVAKREYINAKQSEGYYE